MVNIALGGLMQTGQASSSRARSLNWCSWVFAFCFWWVGAAAIQAQTSVFPAPDATISLNTSGVLKLGVRYVAQVPFQAGYEYYWGGTSVYIPEVSNTNMIAFYVMPALGQGAPTANLQCQVKAPNGITASKSFGMTVENVTPGGTWGSINVATGLLLKGATYSASAARNDPTWVYNWVVQGGSIIQGQGTGQIKVQVTAETGARFGLKCTAKKPDGSTVDFGEQPRPVIADLSFNLVVPTGMTVGKTYRARVTPLLPCAYSWITETSVSRESAWEYGSVLIKPNMAGIVSVTCTASKVLNGASVAPVQRTASSMVITKPAQAVLVINEVGSTKTSNASRWLEVHNVSNSAVNLSDFKLRSQAITKPGATIIISPSVTFDLPNMEIKAGGYAIIRGISYDYLQFNGPDLACIDSTDHTTMPYWGADGYIELLNNGASIDYMRFGTITDSSATASAWNSSSNAPALPLAYGQSLARNLTSDDSNTAEDWTLHTISTFGGPNDVINDTASDGDGIPDECKAPGKTFAGLPLYDWGARPGKKDVFIHLDYMNISQSLDPKTQVNSGIIPQKRALDKFAAAFASRGIAIHIDTGAQQLLPTLGDLSGYGMTGTADSHMVAYQQFCYCPDTMNLGALPYRNNLHYIKAQSMPIARRQIFFYILFGDSQTTPNEKSTGIAETPGNDCLITLGHLGLNALPDVLINFQAATLMHEFGHNLGLKHGGYEGIDFKPNYFSTMNHLYQLSGLPDIQNPADRYYLFRSFDNNFKTRYSTTYRSLEKGPFSSPSVFKMDYSDGSGIATGPINENGQIDESKGILRDGSGAIDFDGNGSNNSSGLSFNINNDQTPKLDVNGNPELDADGKPILVPNLYSLNDYDDWHHVSSIFDASLDGDINPEFSEDSNGSTVDIKGHDAKAKHRKLMKQTRDKIKSKTNDTPNVLEVEAPFHFIH